MRFLCEGLRSVHAPGEECGLPKVLPEHARLQVAGPSAPGLLARVWGGG
jgi:hypothetical protein